MKLYATTNSQVSATSNEPIVTSSMLVFFFVGVSISHGRFNHFNFLERFRGAPSTPCLPRVDFLVRMTRQSVIYTRRPFKNNMPDFRQN